MTIHRSAADGYAVAGAVPPYRLPGCIVEHHPAGIGVPTGHLRGGAHGYTCFFTECFLDELAHQAGMEPVSWRIGMLGGDARLARCLSTAAALGGWDGGASGSGQGIACHAMAGSCIAVLAEASVGDDGRPHVDRLVAAVDCGRQINPDLVRQQIEGGLIFGVAAATSPAVQIDRNLVTARRLGHDMPVNQAMGSMTSSVPPKRSARKVSGSAFGMPYLATIKPVLQINTNHHGMAARQIAARSVPAISRPCGAFAGEGDTVRCSLIREHLLPAQGADGGPPVGTDRRGGSSQNARRPSVRCRGRSRLPLR